MSSGVDRCCSEATGRFLSRDPAMDGRNWYTYCADNPLLFTDGNGLFTLAVGTGYGLIAGGFSVSIGLAIIIDPQAGDGGRIGFGIGGGFGLGGGAAIGGGPQASLDNGSLDYGGSSSGGEALGVATPRGCIEGTIADDGSKGLGAGTKDVGEGLYLERRHQVVYAIDIPVYRSKPPFRQGPPPSPYGNVNAPGASIPAGPGWQNRVE
jgi:hypothetical protein